VHEVALTALPVDRFEPIIEPRQAEDFAEALAFGRWSLDGRVFWHVNSTDTGGGVAELLQSVLGYLRGAHIDARWLSIDGDESFFTVTKRLHHLLHGENGDGGGLGDPERAAYEDTLAGEAAQLCGRLSPGDVVVLHDPQALGLAPAVRDAGARVVFGCHIGADTPNAETRGAWEFLRPYVTATMRQVFSRAAYTWEGLDPEEVAIIPPCIDAFSPKNQDLSPMTVGAVLARSGVVPDDQADASAAFVRMDGTPAVVQQVATMVEDRPVPGHAPVVTQISRWDALKDHARVMEGLVSQLAGDGDAELILAGPAPDGVADDPEQSDVLGDLVEAWRSLPAAARARVHIACLPLADVEENAAIVNALQRRADVVVQKSLAEGFGLTVAEAMWKGRAVVGSRVGGIQDQIDDGVSGRLIDDPTDTAALGVAVKDLLADPETRARLGAAAHQRVTQDYLAPCFLTRYLDVATALLA
jgi:trehalose synthase